MAIKTQRSGFDVYTIISSDGGSQASFVPEKGGVGSSIILSCHGQEREILFLHDDFWQKSEKKDLAGGWPFLFPICARLERMGQVGDYLYDGNLYNMPIHGFAAYMPWKILEADKPDTLVLELSATKETLAMYPFKFKVQLNYKIVNGKLICRQIYTNADDKPMPYYAGFHPYFLTPETNRGKDKVMLNYQPQRRFRYNSRLTDLIGQDDLFELPTSITNPEINEQLTAVNAGNEVTLAFPDGFSLSMKINNNSGDNLFPYIQLYTMPEKPFICVEPWMSFPNALNTVLGARILAPGCSETAVLDLCSKSCN